MCKPVADRSANSSLLRREERAMLRRAGGEPAPRATTSALCRAVVGQTPTGKWRTARSEERASLRGRQHGTSGWSCRTASRVFPRLARAGGVDEMAAEAVPAVNP